VTETEESRVSAKAHKEREGGREGGRDEGTESLGNFLGLTGVPKRRLRDA
jgi:hypothetical protein